MTIKSYSRAELTGPLPGAAAMTALHIGPLPVSPIVLAEIQNSHRLGFSTILEREYRRLIAAGFETDQFKAALAAGLDLI